MRQTITQLLDDLDQATEAVETFQFSYGGKQYELDLNAENAEQFRAAIEPWVAAATPVRRTGKRAVSSQAAARRDGSTGRSRQIREWAESAGIPVSDRGRIPQTVVDQYEAAHSTKRASSGSSGSSRSDGRKTAAKKTTAQKTAAQKTTKTAAKQPAKKAAGKSAGKRASTKQSG